MSEKYWLKADIFEVTGRFRSCETTEGRWLLPSINSPYLENQAMSQSEEKAVLKSPGKNFLDLCWQHPLWWVSWATRPKNEYECWKKTISIGATLFWGAHLGCDKYLVEKCNVFGQTTWEILLESWSVATPPQRNQGMRRVVGQWEVLREHGATTQLSQGS